VILPISSQNPPHDTRIVPFKGNGHEPPKPRRVIHWDGESEAIPQVGWLVKKIIPAQGVGVLAGQSGMCKTYCAIDLALATILGTEFAGQAVDKQGGVLFLAAEGATLVYRRWAAVKKAKAAPWFAQQGEDVRRLPFAWMDEVPVLTADNALKDILEDCTDVNEGLKVFDTKLVLVIVDTLMAAAMFRDPNDAGEAQKTMNVLSKLAQETAAAVLVVDHFGKDPDRGVRGSSAKEAAADFVLAVKGNKNGDGIASDLELVVTKLRGGATGLRCAFNLAEVGLGVDEYAEPVSDMVLHWHEGAAPRKRAHNNRRFAALMKALDEALDTHGVMRSPAAGWPVVKVVEDRYVRTAFAVRYPPTGDEKSRADTISKAYRRAMRDSSEEKLICSYAPDTGEVLVWKVSADSTGQHQESKNAVQRSVRPDSTFPHTSGGMLSVTDDDYDMEF
jgi:hypothetical protein